MFLQPVAPALSHFAHQNAQALQGLVFNVGSSFSLLSLFLSFCIALAFLLGRNGHYKHDLKLRVVWRAFVPRRMRRNRSVRADLLMLLLNATVFAGTVGVAVISAQAVAHGLRDQLTGLFGAARLRLPGPGARAVATVALFLAYELAYWTNHYASHRVPLLWEFHRVHHTAEVLTPMTTFRVHPVDSLVFANFLAVFSGLTSGLVDYLLGQHAAAFTIGRANLIFIALAWLVAHLQHSHFWIPAPRSLNRVIMSPAHHQLHHSNAAEHHDSNYGSLLAIWDWAFGTLVIPLPRRPPLTFGAGPALPQNHSLGGLLLAPFGRCWRLLFPAAARRASAEEA